MDDPRFSRSKDARGPPLRIAANVDVPIFDSDPARGNASPRTSIGARGNPGKWLRRHGIDPKDPDWHSRLHDLEPAVEDEFHDKFSDQFHRYLDTGYGECVLRRPEAAEIVADSLSHFDGERYLLGDLVAMPNHVHLLVMLFLGTQLPGQCYSWKKYTAGKVNELLGRKGHFWQTESYDRIVRDQEELEHYRKYIAADPRNARLTCGEYVHWRRP